MDAILPSQPVTYGQLIKRSLLLYCISFTKTILLALFLSIIVFIPRLISDMIGQDIFQNLAPYSPHRLWIVLINILSLGFFVAIIWHMYCVARNVREPFIEDVMVGIKKAIYVFIAAIVESVIIFAVAAIMLGIQILLYENDLLFYQNLLGLLVTIAIFAGQFILLLYLSVLFIFFVPLIAIENKGIFSALKKSVLLAWNHWWRVFSVQITPWICYVILLMMIKYALKIDINIYFIAKTSDAIRDSILLIIIFALYVPWVAALLLVQLKDLEIRRALAHPQ